MVGRDPPYALKRQPRRQPSPPLRPSAGEGRGGGGGSQNRLAAAPQMFPLRQPPPTLTLPRRCGGRGRGFRPSEQRPENHRPSEKRSFIRLPVFRRPFVFSFLRLFRLSLSVRSAIGRFRRIRPSARRVGRFFLRRTARRFGRSVLGWRARRGGLGLDRLR